MLIGDTTQLTKFMGPTWGPTLLLGPAWPTCNVTSDFKILVQTSQIQFYYGIRYIWYIFLYDKPFRCHRVTSGFWHVYALTPAEYADLQTVASCVTPYITYMAWHLLINLYFLNHRRSSVTEYICGKISKPFWQAVVNITRVCIGKHDSCRGANFVVNWWQQRLLWRQPLVPPVMTKLAPWVSVCVLNLSIICMPNSLYFGYVCLFRCESN